MKRLLLFGVILFSIQLVNAQNYFEGKIKWDVEYTLTEDQKTMESYLPKSIDYTVKDKNMKMDMLMMGMQTSVIMKSATKEYFTLMNMMGQKMAMKMTEADLKIVKHDSSKVIIEKVSETKTIAGYVCSKALVTDDKGVKSTIWYTTKLPMVYDPQYSHMKVGGLILGFDTVTDGMKVSMIAVSVSKETILNTVFDIPEGYQLVDKSGLKK